MMLRWLLDRYVLVVLFIYVYASLPSIAACAKPQLGCPCSGIKSSRPKKITLELSDGRHWELWCRNGKKHGKSTIWSAKGTKISEEMYRDGKRHGLSRRWYPDGATAEESVYHYGNCATSKKWHTNGEWQYYGEWDEQGESRYQISWNESGKIVMEAGLPTASTPIDVPRTSSDTISADIIKLADGYIIHKVGKHYFKDNYTFVRVKSEFHATKDGKREYFLRYKYKPLQRIGSAELVFIRMFDGIYTPQDYVASINEGRVIEPTVPKEQALNTASKEFTIMPTDGVAVHMVTPNRMYSHLKNWTWVVCVNRRSTSQPELGTTTTIFVDAVTGKYLDKRTKSWME